MGLIKALFADFPLLLGFRCVEKPGRKAGEAALEAELSYRKPSRDSMERSECAWDWPQTGEKEA